MNEKVKLPRNVIDVFRPALDSPGYKRLGSLTPIRIISDMYNRTLEGMTSDVAAWLNDYDNQWLLIDALRYGYEAEPEHEPQWAIKAGNYYVHRCEYELIKLTKSLSLARVYTKESTEQMVKALGFGEVIDLNEEV